MTPIGYSLTIILRTKDAFLAFLYHFLSFVILLSVLDAFFLVSEDPVDDVETQLVLIRNTDDSQLCNISLYPTLYLITKQLNSNQPV